MPDLGNIQALIVHNPSQNRCFLPLFRIDGSAADARRFLDWCRPRVPSAADDLSRFPAPLYPSLSWNGISRLCEGDPALVPEEGARLLEPFFVRYTPDHRSVAADMGLAGASAPMDWWAPGITNADIHIGVHAYFNDDDREAEAGVAELRERARGAGLTELELPRFPGHTLNGYRPKDGVLHFGYRDGISAPGVDWTGTGAAPVDFREFLLGYGNEDYAVGPYAPGPWQDFVRDGSFACIAWIHQDVARFNQFLEREGERLPGGREWLAAKMMGRWRDGSPVMRHPTAAPPRPDHDDDFGYASDPDGGVCPLNAHIRVVNPRDQTLEPPNRRRFPKGPPRFIRRGFTYGPSLEGMQDDGRERGIVGTFYCARINEQFYTVLRWINETGFSPAFHRKPHTATMQDALFGTRHGEQADTRMFLDPAAPEQALGLDSFITYRGVTALFTPSLTSLERLGREL